MLKVLGKLLLLLLPVCRLAAAPGPDTAQLVRTLSVEQGLPQSFVSGLVQDRQGFVWIASRDGLARYDGRRFKLFNYLPGDTNMLANNTITNLYYDRSGWLWILYETGQLDRLHTTTEKLEHLSSQPFCRGFTDSLKETATVLKSFTEDDAGNVWLLVPPLGIYIFSIAQHSLHYYNNAALHLTHNSIQGMAKRDSKILLVTNTALVMVDAQHPISEVVRCQFPEPLVSAISRPTYVSPVIRKNGEIVVLSEGRLSIYQPASNAFITLPLPPSKSFVYQSIVQDESGYLFFDYGGTIYRLSPNNTLQIWAANTGPFNPSVCMLPDRSGMLWVGGNASPIRLYDRRLTHLQGSAYSSVTERFIQGVLTRHIGIDSVFVESILSTWPKAYGLRWTKWKDGITWIAVSSNNPFIGHTYLLTNGGLQQIAWKMTGTANDKAALQNISALAFSSTGRLWGVDFGLHPILFDPATRSAVIYPAIPLALQGAKSLVVDGDSIFWISTMSQGIVRYHLANGHLQQYWPGHQVPEPYTYNTSILQQDPANPAKLWVGTTGDGLLHFDKKTGRSEVYSTVNGLPNNTVYTILPDAKGRIWGSTNNGLFRLDPATGTIYHFTSKDGLSGNEFNRFQFFCLPDGRIAFGGVDGYVVFDPMKVAEDNFEPETVLTDIAINNQPSDYGKPNSPLVGAINSLDLIELPYTSNILGFEFAALEYNIPEKLQYRYRLEGIDEKWVAAGHNNTAVYTKLPPGHYTLLVNATNTAGKWSSKIKRLEIVIHPPFWRTWWFVLLCSLVAASLVFGIIYSRLTAIRNKEKQQLAYEREAMELEAQALRAQMNPHFIFNCLNSIKSLIQEDKKREAVVYLTTFSKLIRNQLSNAQKEVSLHDELETCKLYVQLEELRFGDKITSAFTVDEAIDTHTIMVPPLIIQPFIENAIWHGIVPLEKGGYVNVSVTHEPGLIKCMINDNGIGRERSGLNKSKTSPTHKSKGMQLIKERLDLHSQIYNRGGRIEIIDKKDNLGNALGTSVILYLKKEI